MTRGQKQSTISRHKTYRTFTYYGFSSVGNLDSQVFAPNRSGFPWKQVNHAHKRFLCSYLWLRGFRGINNTSTDCSDGSGQNSPPPMVVSAGNIVGKRTSGSGKLVSVNSIFPFMRVLLECLTFRVPSLRTCAHVYIQQWWGSTVGVSHFVMEEPDFQKQSGTWKFYSVLAHHAKWPVTVGQCHSSCPGLESSGQPNQWVFKALVPTQQWHWHI